VSVTISPLPGSKSYRPAVLNEWWPVLLGLLVLYVPTYLYLGTRLWHIDAHAHGPIVLLVVFFLFWRKRVVFVTDTGDAAPVAGWIAIGLGLLGYVVGRSQDVIVLEAFTQIPLLVGAVLVMRGWCALRALAFPIGYLFFLVPVPFFLIDWATGWLKQHVTVIVTGVLYRAGFPIAHQGVTLTIGNYQLLVDDACSGLNSLYTITAMGFLYLYLRSYRSKPRLGVMLASLLPIGFAANIIRVTVLVLITYFFGDEAGQGFMHGFSGISVFVIALLFLFLLDFIYGAAARRFS
jgi:exosortase B